LIINSVEAMSDSIGIARVVYQEEKSNGVRGEVRIQAWD